MSAGNEDLRIVINIYDPLTPKEEKIKFPLEFLQEDNNQNNV